MHPWPALHPQLTEARTVAGTAAAAVKVELTEAGCLSSKVLMKPITFLKVRYTEKLKTKMLNFLNLLYVTDEN